MYDDDNLDPMMMSDDDELGDDFTADDDLEEDLDFKGLDEEEETEEEY